ncbi:MAG: hypothetical protein RMJ53_09725 [Chitinophagales bacterium]|nr:hypothetical protein [Chitinophagales bacterium]MDW8274493.1 hypothetical protein [Chitinophagales bacterium]
MKKTKILLTPLFLLLFLFQSCKKEDITTDENITRKREFERATFKQAEINLITIKAGILAASIIEKNGYAYRLRANHRMMNCEIVTIDSSSNPYHFTIEFPNGCTDDEGRPLHGLITGTITPEFDNPGDFIDIQFVNFEYDNILFNGTARIDINTKGPGVTTATLNSNLATTFEFGKYKLDGSNTFYLSGIDDPNNTSLNRLEFEGGGHGTTGGVSFTQTITSTLRIPMDDPNCDAEHFIEGEVLFQATGLPNRVINYGNGQCDNVAFITENGVTTRFFLDD